MDYLFFHNDFLRNDIGVLLGVVPICLVGKRHGRGDLHRVGAPTGMIVGQVVVYEVLESTAGPAGVLLGWPAQVAVAPPSSNGP